MDMSFKRWELPPLNKDEAALLAEECEIHPFLALMLHLRGIQSAEEAAEYVAGGELTDDPLRFRRYGRRGGRLQRALDSGERVAVYGDYDCDGVTSTVLLYSYLKEKWGGCPLLYPGTGERGATGCIAPVWRRWRRKGTPHRHSGQRRGRGGGGRLRRRTGCGRGGHGSSYAAGPYAPGRWRWWIPHRPDCGSACKDYAGVGVAFKLVCALDGDADAVAAEYGDLVALGTLADVMQLPGENRKLVRMGGCAVLRKLRAPG